MKTRIFLSRTLFGLALSATAGLASCSNGNLPSSDHAVSQEQIGSEAQAITDVPHTRVERQSIGNCWLYAEATWVESMALAKDPSAELDISQSYWTYWHWFDQVTDFWLPSEIQTGGYQYLSHSIVLDRGFMHERDFVPDDTLSEMSNRQASALATINAALANGDFEGADGKRVREIFDEAWGLSAEVRAQLDQVFGEDGEGTIRSGASVAGSSIVDPSTVDVRYTRQVEGQTEAVDSNLVDAILSWEEVAYPYNESDRREFQKRVQRALHDRQPVVITWDVDFNALESTVEERRGSFNLTTLKEAGRPGGQGGHMTVLEDYQAETAQFGLLEAGVTLDPQDPQDAAKLEAALLDDTRLVFLRTKNSWGADRPDRGFAPGFPGYHDLYMDYLNGPIPFCPGAVNPTNETCLGESNPLRAVLLPPGY